MILGHVVFETAMGWCALAWSPAGVALFELPSETVAVAERRLLRRAGGTGPAEPTAAVAEAVGAARRYFAGQATDLSDVALDLGAQAPLWREIYAAARRVPWGRTTTYGALAAEVGQGREAAREVGQAMARNPTPLFVPCHRVLAAGGRIGGFSAAGGAATKRRMLEMEGAALAPEQGAFAF